MNKGLASKLQENQRSDSDLILGYLSKTKELEYERLGNMFILWKMNGNVLEIHDIYSEEDSGVMLEFVKLFVAGKDCKWVEGYIDKEYSDRFRSHKILTNFGFKKYKDTEDYVYYRMEKEDAPRW